MSKDHNNALLSVYDKTGIEEFGDGLVEQGFNIFASGGTAKRLTEAGVPVTDVAELVGGSAILGHRVVTLSREVHAGLLAQKTPEDLAELDRLGIPLIDLVAVDMYPLRDALADPDKSDADILEMTDIGGPTMLRAGAKGRRIVLSRAAQRPEVLAWMRAGRPDEEEFRRQLAAVAESEVARYVLDSARHLGGPAIVGFAGYRTAKPLYGENPWQKEAGLYTEGSDDPLAITAFKQLEGRELSYNNYTDIDRGLQTATHIAAIFEKNFNFVPAISLGIKHGNVCGVAVSDLPEESIKRMLEGDVRAIFGGTVVTNFNIDAKLAELLRGHAQSGGKRILDVIAAAGANEEALEILSRKEGKGKVLVNPAMESLGQHSIDEARRIRYVRGGILAQDNYTFIPNIFRAEIKAGGWMNHDQEQDMALAHAINATSNSNTITLVKNGMLIGNGVGQQDRVGAVELAIKRAQDAGHDVRGSVAASDSFFPYPDGPIKLAEAGVNVIFATSGSVKDEEVATALKELGIQSFVTLPDTEARGFYAH